MNQWLKLVPNMENGIDQLGQIEVLSSAAGWYIGTMYFDSDCQAWLPYERLSGYYPNAESALEDLPNYL